jgi:hypothetical protein
MTEYWIALPAFALGMAFGWVLCVARFKHVVKQARKIKSPDWRIL